jgi:hypothetical protein
MAGNKLPKAETEKRVMKCFNLRFNSDSPIRQDKWIEYCHENYADKSEVQYHQYWAKAFERYNQGWKSKLENLLDPAVDELNRLLSSEDEKIRQRALDQIMKYTGNDIQKIQADIKGEINITFGENE